MQLLTEEHRAKLLDNGRARERHYERSDDIYDPAPVVKLFNAGGAGVWLIAWADPDEPERLFGLCEIVEPELGFVSLRELRGIQGGFGLGVERDIHWSPRGTLMEYAAKARETGDIRSADSALYRAWFAGLPGKERAEITGTDHPCPDCGADDCPAIGRFGAVNCQGEAQGRAA